MFDLKNPPAGFFENPYPIYKRMREQAPVLPQDDGTFVISSYQALDRIYRDTTLFSSDKTELFKPKYGQTPLYEHHTTSLVFNDPPLHTRVRKIIVGAMTPKAISRMEPGLITLVDSLLDGLEGQSNTDLVENFAALIPINIIGNLFDMPMEDRSPLRDWSLAILGALEPTLSPEQHDRGNDAVSRFKAYLKDLVTERRKNPGDPETDVLTRLMQSDVGELTENELLQNCIFILNAGHETTTNLIGNALGALAQHPEVKQQLVDKPELISTAVDEFLRFESPNQFGNRLTTADVDIEGISIGKGTDLHLCIGAANRNEDIFPNAEKMDITRRPNRHFAFAGGPHTCVGLSLARLEGRIAVGRFLDRFPNYQITSSKRSPRLRFRGYETLYANMDS